MTANPVDRLAAAIETATVYDAGAFGPDAVLDATVPHWRFTVRGGRDVEQTLAGWFADPGRFEDLRRLPIPGGELLEFTLAWEENGIPHTSHQAHLLEVRGDHIMRDTAFCGGRWPADLMAEMAAAEAHNA